MLDDFDELGLFAFAELHQLRAQALDLFDRCLTEGNFAPVLAFIEQQLAWDPPQLQLLRDFAEDLHMRLLSLRAYHFDVRNNVVRAFAEDYGVDITPLAPANALEQYHNLDPQQVISYVQERNQTLAENDVIILTRLLEESVRAGGRLLTEIQMTGDLYRLVIDWFEAHSRTVGRRYWPEEAPPRKPRVH
jgi:hypothetical protein